MLLQIIITAFLILLSNVILAVVIGGNSEAKRLEEIQELNQKREETEIAYDNKIKTLVSKNDMLKAQNEELQRRYTKLENEIAELKARDNNTIIAELEAEIKEYQEKLKEYTLPDKEAIPDGATNMYQCMDYRKITNKQSEQWRLQEQCITNATNGIREYGGYYTVAMAANYGRQIGDCWRVTLNNGNGFYIMLGDFKDDGKDPYRMGDPCKNYDEQDCTNVIEFIVDMDAVPNEVVKAGTMSKLDYFGGLNGNGGNIAKLEYLGYVSSWKGD